MTEESTGSDREPIQIHYEKGPTYSNIYADGAVVAPNGRGMISVSFYSQRFTIPKLAHLVRSEDDAGGEEQEIDGKSGLFRQIEASVFLDPAAAKDLIDWLNTAVEFIERSAAEHTSDEDGE